MTNEKLPCRLAHALHTGEILATPSPRHGMGWCADMMESIHTVYTFTTWCGLKVV
ncbi:hypothetical protein HanHA89_Chr03g0123571 [Helianthus annuus]|nr:hypothetical protein HanHA89_Chr03g0123571 [Helianthus annuus]